MNVHWHRHTIDVIRMTHDNNVLVLLCLIINLGFFLERQMHEVGFLFSLTEDFRSRGLWFESGSSQGIFLFWINSCDDPMCAGKGLIGLRPSTAVKSYDPMNMLLFSPKWGILLVSWNKLFWLLCQIINWKQLCIYIIMYRSNINI